MGFQFVHEECYARVAAKGKVGGHSVRSILAEAQREPAACPHVEAPQPPVLLHGVPLDQVEQRAHEYAENMRDARGRKLRSDAPVLLAGVVSCPPELSDEAWKRLHEESVAALRERYGDRLLSVVEHTDEDKRHLHYYAVPRDGERFDSLHTGRGAKAKAEAEAKAAGATKKQVGEAGNNAYRAERRQFQDWFFERVGVRHGLTRLGPRKRRLSRPAWKAEQAQAAAAAHAAAMATDASRRAAELTEEAKRRVREAMEAQEAARQAQAAARQVEQEAARRAHAEAVAARRAERRRVVAEGRQRQAEERRAEAQKLAELAETFAAPIEEQAKKLKADETALAADRKKLDAERGTLRTEQSRLRVQREALVRRERRLRGLGRVVGLATRSAVRFARWAIQPLRDRRHARELEDLERSHEAALAEARRSGHASGRADAERETKPELTALRDSVQKHSSDAKSLRKQLGLPEDAAPGERHDLTARPGRPKKVY